MEWDRNLEAHWPCLRRRLKAGRGCGHGSEYLPWLGLREKPGQKTVAKPFGLITSRQHQLRTEAAEAYLYLLERRNGMADIRELFPVLDLNATLEICGSLGIEHEYLDANPEPFLIDFLITRRVGDDLVYSARSLTSSKGLVEGRRGEEFQVLNAWCKAIEVDWRPVDASELTPALIESLDFLRGWHRARYTPDRQAIQVFSEHFKRLHRKGSTLAELVEDVSAKTGESVERCVNHFRYAGWAEFIKVDIRHALAMNKPVRLYAASNA